MTSLLFVSLLLSLLLYVHSSRTERGSNTPERSAIYDELADSGCTNKLIASYVINAALDGVSSKYLKTRISNISGYTITESKLTTWINVVKNYYS